MIQKGLVLWICVYLVRVQLDFFKVQSKYAPITESKEKNKIFIFFFLLGVTQVSKTPIGDTSK